MSQILVGTVANDGTGDPLRTAFQKLNQSMVDCYNVKYYGAKGDGTTDDTAAINAAIAAAGVSGIGGIVMLPPGNYRIVTSLLMNQNDVWLYGAGRNVSVILCATASIDAVKVTGQRCILSDLGINYSVAANAGTYALRITDSGRSRYRDCVIGATNGSPSNAYHGVLIEATAGAASETNIRNFFERCLVGACAGVGITLTGGSLTRRVLDQGFDMVYISSCTDTGILFNDYVQGLFYENGIIDFCGRSANIASTNTLNTFNVFFSNTKFDAVQTNEHLIAANTRECYVYNCWFGDAVAGKYSVIFNTGCSRMVLSNSYLGGKETAGAYNGVVQILGNTVRVTNNYLKQGATAPTTAGVVIAAGASNNDLSANTFEGFAVGKDISDAGTATRIGPNYDDAYGAVAKFHSGLDLQSIGAVAALVVANSGIVARSATSGQQLRLNAGSPAAAEIVKFDASAYDNFRVGALFTAVAAPAAAAGQVAIGSTTASTVGAAGGASALPATPVGYLIINVAGTQMKLPYYNT